jgi:hypothetical protein
LFSVSLTEASDDIIEFKYPPDAPRRMPDWINHGGQLGNDDLWDLMHQVYIAVQNDLRRLAAMGIRAAFEMVMIDKSEDRGSFVKNIDAFQAKGYLSVRQRHVIESILEAGHASIHRNWDPDPKDLDVLLDVIESVIESVYLHEHRSQDLEGRLPRRPSRQRRPE